MTWSLQRSRVIGGMRAAQLSAPFARARVVVSSDEHPDRRLIVTRCDADATAHGEELSDRDWHDLVEAEEALELHATTTARGAPRLWLLRGNFPERSRALEELKTHAHALLHEEQREDVHVMTVDETHARPLLDSWSRRAFDNAWALARKGEWALAVEHADLAWLTDLSLKLDHVALYALALEHTAGASAAEDIIVAEENSRLSLEGELRGLIAHYRARLEVPQRNPRLAPFEPVGLQEELRRLLPAVKPTPALWQELVA